MKHTGSKHTKLTRRPRRASTPRLKLVHGGKETAPKSNGAASRVRDGVVDRARTRVSKGFYDRPRVQRELVETLWKELCSD